jgi:hypothetical protein
MAFEKGDGGFGIGEVRCGSWRWRWRRVLTMQAGQQPAFSRSAGVCASRPRNKNPARTPLVLARIWLVGGPACGFARDDWVRSLAYGIGF